MRLKQFAITDLISEKEPGVFHTMAFVTLVQMSIQ